MTKEEYLELKDFLIKGRLAAEELRRQLPISDKKLHIPSFEIGPNDPLTEEEKKKNAVYLEMRRKLFMQEEDNDLAADLIRCSGWE